MANPADTVANSQNIAQVNISLQPQTKGFKVLDPSTGQTRAFFNWDRKMKDAELYIYLSNLAPAEIIQLLVDGVLVLEQFEIGTVDNSAGADLMARMKAGLNKA